MGRIWLGKKVLFFGLILILGTGFIPLAYGAETSFQVSIDEYMNAAVKAGQFSGSILIAQKGEVIIKKGYGMANYEWFIPNTPDTKFRLGSVTKQFAAVCILQLKEKGLLSVDDPLQKYIPGYPHGNEITIHHLLTHTSGIPNFTDFPDYGTTMMIPSPLEKTFERFKNLPLDFQPGEKYSYSNSNYVLLGYIIEKVSGQSFEKYLQENILDRLQMVNSGYDHSEKIIEKRASGYELLPEGLINTPYMDMSIPHAAGAMYSTVEDMYLWDQGLYTEKLLSKASLDQMFTPNLGNYGYGWMITTAFGRKLISHSGGINGFISNITRFVDDRMTVIVLSNFGYAHSDRIALTLSAIIFGEPYEIPKERTFIEVDPTVLDAYVGQYEIQPGLTADITRKDQHLFIQVQGQPAVELLPETENQFYIRESDATLTFLKDEKGEISRVLLKQNGKDVPLKKIK